MANVGDLSKIGLEDKALWIKKRLKAPGPLLFWHPQIIGFCAAPLRQCCLGYWGDQLIVSREAAHWSLNTHSVMVGAKDPGTSCPFVQRTFKNSPWNVHFSTFGSCLFVSAGQRSLPASLTPAFRRSKRIMMLSSPLSTDTALKTHPPTCWRRWDQGKEQLLLK